jgi:hypothetical protein
VTACPASPSSSTRRERIWRPSVDVFEERNSGAPRDERCFAETSGRSSWACLKPWACRLRSSCNRGVGMEQAARQESQWRSRLPWWRGCRAVCYACGRRRKTAYGRGRSPSSRSRVRARARDKESTGTWIGGESIDDEEEEEEEESRARVGGGTRKVKALQQLEGPSSNQCV